MKFCVSDLMCICVYELELSLWFCISTGPVCGKFDATQKNMTLKTNEVTVTFKSGLHRSGRGFLLSYATDQYPGMTAVYLLWFKPCW